jgi:hypothetical protein
MIECKDAEVGSRDSVVEFVLVKSTNQQINKSTNEPGD